MRRNTVLSLAIASGLACGTGADREEQKNASSLSLVAGNFVANARCTIGATWDPQIGAPSPAALRQLAPQGQLRVGVFTGNRAIGQQNATTGALSGPAVDVACRIGAQLGLPMQLVTDPSLPNFLARYRAGEFDIGFSTDITLAAADQAVAHATIGVENTYLVPIGSAFQHVDEVDQPGVLIAVPQGASPDLYLSAHLKYATLVRALSTTGVQSTAAFNLLKAGQVDAVATGRSGEQMFIDTSWPGQGRVLPENIFVAQLAPFMQQGNADALCWLGDYVEAAKTSGLLAQAIARAGIPLGLSVPAPSRGCAPTARCRDVIVAADASCRGSASINAGSDDADSDLAGCTQDPPGPYALGSTPVTLTCADTAGQTSSCTATVTVVDTTPPVIACPADQILECTNEGAVASFVATATDNCGAVAVQCTPPSGTTLPEDPGSTGVTCVAVDSSGNQAACRFQIAVRDTRPPTVTTKAVTLWPPDHSLRTISLSDCIENVVDECDGELPPTGTILRVTSDEPANARGDGETSADIVIVDAQTVQLRAERDARGDGRVYSIFATVGDDDGNQAPVVCKVQVPHDQSGAPAIDSGAASCVGQGCGAISALADR